MKIIIKGFKIRLEPNNKQRTRLFACAGTSRWAYNYTLDKIQTHYKETGKTIGEYDLRKELTQVKQTDEYKWLYKYSVNIPKQAIKDCYKSYEKFFRDQNRHPKFKSRKKSKFSFYVDTAKIDFTDDSIKIEALTMNRKKNKQLFNWIKMSEKNKVPYGKNIKYLNPRITFDGVNWFISINVEIHDEKLDYTNENKDKNLGIDVGISELAICSDGIRYKNINKTKRIRKLEYKMKRLQKQVSRKYEMNKDGEKFIKTKNILKLGNIIRKLYRKLYHIRADYRHKTTTKIVKTKPLKIAVEDLDIKGMMKNKHISKAVQDQSLYEFIRQIEDKCKCNDIEFIKANRWYPSSKVCSSCGDIKKDLKLSDRVYKCNCGFIMDRDLNASMNLANY